MVLTNTSTVDGTHKSVANDGTYKYKYSTVGQMMVLTNTSTV